MIDNNTAERIKAAANIVDVVGSYVELKRAGVNYKACCPFHNEKTPSFIVFPGRGRYKCFGCGEAGDAVSFVQKQEAMTYPEALKHLASKYGIEVQETRLSKEDIKLHEDRESMFALNSWVSDYFVRQMNDTDEGLSVGKSYLRTKRHFTDATITRFRLGYCPQKGDVMTQDALRAGYKEEFLLKTGLTLKKENTDRLTDRFRGRVMFPIHNISGRVVGFGGRILFEDKEKKFAKYQNSPESDIYSKKNELYGLYFAQKAIQRQGFAIMVEGYTDVISMHQSGVENVVASSGTSLTKEQINLLKRFTSDITVMYDGDKAGMKASLRGIDLILEQDLNVRVVLLPEPEDPDSYARTHSPEQTIKYVEDNAENFITFKAKLLMQDAEGDPIRKSEAIQSIVDSIAKIPAPIKRRMFIVECSKVLSDVDEQTLTEAVAHRIRIAINDEEVKSALRQKAEQAKTRETQTGQQNNYGQYSGGYYQRPYNRPQAQFPAPSEDEINIPIEGVNGGSAEALEKELVWYLLKHGQDHYEFREGQQILEINVAREIVDELVADNMSFANPLYQKILEFFQHSISEGRIPGAVELLEIEDAEVNEFVSNVLMPQDDYEQSRIWEQNDVHVSSDMEMLGVGVPKAILLYKTKTVTSQIEQIQREIESGAVSEERQIELTQDKAKLNRAKVFLSKQLNRTII